MKTLSLKEINIINQLNITPRGKTYQFTQEEIETIVNTFVEQKTGFDLNLKVGCMNPLFIESETVDVYVEWNIDDLNDDDKNKIIEEYNKFEKEESRRFNDYEPLNLSVHEDIDNRNTIFSRIFGSDDIEYGFNNDFDTNFYTLTTINNSIIDELNLI